MRFLLCRSDEPNIEHVTSSPSRQGTSNHANMTASQTRQIFIGRARPPHPCAVVPNRSKSCHNQGSIYLVTSLFFQHKQTARQHMSQQLLLHSNGLYRIKDSLAVVDGELLSSLKHKRGNGAYYVQITANLTVTKEVLSTSKSTMPPNGG